MTLTPDLLRHYLPRAGMLTLAMLLGTTVGVVTGAQADSDSHAVRERLVRPVEAEALESFPSRPLRQTPQA